MPGSATSNGIHSLGSSTPGKPWVVQKYGGTSVGKLLATIAGTIIPRYRATSKLVIVCSALSGTTKAAGTTSLLLLAARQAVDSPPSHLKSLDGSRSPVGTPFTSSQPGSPSRAPSPEVDFRKTIAQVEDFHLQMAEKILGDGEQGLKLLQSLETAIRQDCNWLRAFLAASEIVGELSARSLDAVVGVGERLCCRIVVAALQQQGITAELTLFETIVQDVYGLTATSGTPEDSADAIAVDDEFYSRLAQAMGERLRECEKRGNVSVVSGFFGPIPGSLLTRVGRGYTDLCSALCAVGVSASELQIWKEVDGVFTADPRKVPSARVIPMITPDEAAELTSFGSEVIHPSTMHQAIRYGTPIRVKNVLNVSGAGTLVMPDASNSARPDAQAVIDQPSSAFLAANGYHGPERHRRLPTAITSKDDILVLSVSSNRRTGSHGFLAELFRVLDGEGVVVDLVATSLANVSLAIHEECGRRRIERAAKKLKAYGEVSLRNDLAIVSLVGRHMVNAVGIAGEIFTTLASGKINVEMISQGASEINISFVVKSEDVSQALELVHESVLKVPSHREEPGQGCIPGPWLF